MTYMRVACHSFSEFQILPFHAPPDSSSRSTYIPAVSPKVPLYALFPPIINQPIATMVLSGHCLCKAVTYTIDVDEPSLVGYDHCDDCQRQSGSTYCV